MSYAAFDLEIYDDLLPDGNGKTLPYVNQGIACAAMMRRFSGELIPMTETFTCDTGGRMTRDDANELLDRLYLLYDAGFTLLTWNGLSFDFRVLAIETGRFELCKMLALASVDPMFEVMCIKGFPLSLNAACLGMGTVEKVHELVLKSGEQLVKMEGSQAPALWRAGETEAVLTYLKGDVSSLFNLAEELKRRKMLHWTSKKGKPMAMPIDMLTVEQCLKLPVPDTSWMDKPMLRSDFCGWLESAL
jgi:hypothetical protein